MIFFIKHRVHFCLLILLSSCVTKTKFSEEELLWIRPYKAGDTIVFQSDKDNFDTTIIIKSEVYYPEYIPFEVHDRYLPQHGIVIYQNINLENSQNNELVHIYKKYPDRNTRLFINYLGASIIILDLTTAKIEQLKNEEIFEFSILDTKATPSQPKIIYWHDDYGIIKYITNDGTTWSRINIKEF